MPQFRSWIKCLDYGLYVDFLYLNLTFEIGGLILKLKCMTKGMYKIERFKTNKDGKFTNLLGSVQVKVCVAMGQFCMSLIFYIHVHQQCT